MTAIFVVSTVPGLTFTVVNTNDTGPGSLRQAITDANANISVGDTIAFRVTQKPFFVPCITIEATVDRYLFR